MIRWSRSLLLFLPAALLLSGSFVLPASADDDLDTLRRMRADRREASRSLHADGRKSGSQGLFGLLVIPVDFSDARLPDGWQSAALSPRLTPTTGESLHNYFTIASRGRVDVRITLAPLVRLAGTRRDYSDRDLGGNGIRTRAMATEALTAVKDLGLEFRRLDMDGPDLVPGSADDDGEVDGILILHAAAGIENDPAEGLIQPLQFFLEEPVISGGIAATFYAVASMRSGPGIWAHETAHLLGLEDRYDPLLPVEGGHATSRGGLGRFSLMSSGAWGTGEGWGAALPDAYSRVQMGWIPVTNLPPAASEPVVLKPGEAARVWTDSQVGREFFLLETRDPGAAFPFDAGVPGDDLIITHVDETLPEGRWSDDGFGDYHLRVRLVEADDDEKLQGGLDDGRAEDLFPGPLAKTAFTPATIPSSDGYAGPSAVSLTDIRRIPGGVSLLAATATGAGGIPAVPDLVGDWPGEWVVDHPDILTTTTWFRWDTAPFLTADGSPVLACTGNTHPTSLKWPDVSYANRAHTTLTSGPIAAGTVAVRIVHALEAEILVAAEAVDGARLVWVDPAGNEVPAVPVDGYPGRVASRVLNPLHGLPCFLDDSLELEGDIPLWRTEVLPLPAEQGGAWRLRFVFASNPVNRLRGWFVASCELLTESVDSAFPVAWDGDLKWEWPFGSGAREFDVEYLADDRNEWNPLWSGMVTPDPVTGAYRLAGATVLAQLPGSTRTRHAVRVSGRTSPGAVASRSVTIYPDGGDGQAILLAQPWPNPGAAPIRFQMDVPLARTAKVSIFDVRGRLVRRLDYPAGSHLGVWDGRDSGGRRAPSGTYFLRLEGSGPVTTRKVVLLH